MRDMAHLSPNGCNSRAEERGLLAIHRMNALDLLNQQHEKTKKALVEMCEAEDIDPEELRTLADELVAHMVIEEHVFYPRMRELDEDIVGESFEEHAVARFELARAMVAKGDEQKSCITVLKELVTHHIDEEKSELFPKVRRSVPVDELERLGTRMEAMFEKAVEAGIEALVIAKDQSLMKRDGAPTKTKRPSGRAMHAR
jgi:iron-sulfur cluster repair protein YtfE (RIC family)